MKKQFITILFSLFLSFVLSAQYKKDGTPDMRYQANKEQYGNGLISSYSNTNLSVRYQEGYYNKSNSTYVDGLYKTNNNHTNHDNFSTTGNINPYTGKEVLEQETTVPKLITMVVAGRYIPALEVDNII